MSPDSDTSNPLDADDQDLGEPITDLLNLEQDTSPGFLNVVRRKIYRRAATSQFASFSWNVPKMIFVEFWNMLVQLLNPRAASKGGRS
jgi:hypothetical protein